MDKHLISVFMMNIISQLRQPIEIISLGDFDIGKVDSHITSVDVNDSKGGQSDTNTIW